MNDGEQTAKPRPLWAGITYLIFSPAWIIFMGAIGEIIGNTLVFLTGMDGVGAWAISVFIAVIVTPLLSLQFLILAFWKGGTYTRITGGIYVLLIATTIIGIWIWRCY